MIDKEAVIKKLLCCQGNHMLYREIQKKLFIFDVNSIGKALSSVH